MAGARATDSVDSPGACTGTDNEELLASQFYVGSRHARVRGEAYYELLDEFITSAQRRCAGSHLTGFFPAEVSCFAEDAKGVPHNCWAPLSTACRALADSKILSQGQRGVHACPGLGSNAPYPLCVRRFGNTTLIHFEDMSIPNLTRLVNQYRGSLACFSDDVQARCPAAPALTSSALLSKCWTSAGRACHPLST